MVVCAAACGKPLAATGVAKCTQCSMVYHKTCVNIAITARVSGTWACPACKSKRGRDNADNTPIKAAVAEDPEGDATPPSPGDHDDVAEQLRLFRAEFRATREDITGLRHEMAEVSGFVRGFQERFQAVEDRVQRLEEQMEAVQRSTAGTVDGDLAATVAALKSELSDRDQDLLLNDVEVTGIPEQPNESPVHLTCLVAQKLGIKLGERDIVFAERVGPRRVAPAAQGAGVGAPRGVGGPSAAPAGERPRPLVIRLARRGTRTELLRAARVRRGADTSDLGVPGGAARFYVNERLTRLNRALLFNILPYVV